MRSPVSGHRLPPFSVARTDPVECSHETSRNMTAQSHLADRSASIIFPRVSTATAVEGNRQSLPREKLSRARREAVRAIQRLSSRGIFSSEYSGHKYPSHSLPSGISGKDWEGQT